MPQLDLHSYFSAATTLIVLFLSLVFVLHTYYLPKIASCLKLRKKLQNKPEIVHQEQTALAKDETFLELAQTYINEMENIIKTNVKK